MSTNYPGTLDNTTDLVNNFVDATPTATVHAAAHDNMADSVIAVETELGTLPKGTYADVKTRLNDGVYKTPSTAQIIAPSADVVAMTLRQLSGSYVSNFLELRNSLNNTVVFIDHTGLLNVAAFSIAGSPLSSANLSDGATLAPLNSPAFTGNPTAPTQTAGNSSTRLATTAFVQSAISALTIAFDTQAASYTVVLADAQKIVEMNSASANTLTIPLNATVAFPVGTQITVAQLGVGQTSIVATGGVTIRSYNNNLKLAGQNAMASLIKRGTDDWWAAGNLVP